MSKFWSPRLVPNAGQVARKSYSVLFASASALVSLGEAVRQVQPDILPFLPPNAAPPIAAGLAAAAVVGRLIDQGIMPRPAPEDPPKQP